MRRALFLMMLTALAGCSPIRIDETGEQFSVRTAEGWWTAGLFHNVVILHTPASAGPENCEDTGYAKMISVARPHGLTRWIEGRLLVCDGQDAIHLVNWSP